MKALPVRTDTPVKLNKLQIQELYLEIQSRIGVLLAAADIKPETTLQLKHVSAIMFKTKRQWIGVMDEIKEG